ncbi:MobA/MobL family protein [Streptobacillus felis]|uniref:MobA/MobL family protein n=1 Tax=Streptobacillus felis TaxID=1384509 RepID=UPI00082E1311|nr:MobA/MobL family protein [Streptobacillus felis]
MAIYRLRAKAGKDVLPHLSYINGEDKYKNKKDHIEFIETKNLPEIFESVKDFWNTALQYERKNANIYREFEITLPKEFNKEKNKEILDRFLDKTFGKDYVYNYSIHNPNGNQPHAHVMFNERKLDGIKREKENFFKRYIPEYPEKGGAKKNSELKNKTYLKNIRKNWEEHLNLYLESSGIEKISSKTLKKQREESINEGNLIKAEILDREPVHFKQNLKYKKKKNKDAYDLYERIKRDEYIKEKQIKDEADRVYKINFLNEKFEEKKEEFKNYSFEKLLEEKEKVEIDIFKLSKKMLDKTLESEALNQLTNGQSNKNKNEKNHLFKMIKKDKNNRNKYKKRINEINKEMDTYKDIFKEKLIDLKLKLKAKYMKPFKYKMIEKGIVDELFMQRLKQEKYKNQDNINLYKAYFERKNLRDEKLKELKKIESNKQEIKKFVKSKDYKSAKYFQSINSNLYKNIRSLDRISKKFNRDIRVQHQILKHGEFILDEYKNILENEELEIERER